MSSPRTYWCCSTLLYQHRRETAPGPHRPVQNAGCFRLHRLAFALAARQRSPRAALVSVAEPDAVLAHGLPAELDQCPRVALLQLVLELADRRHGGAGLDLAAVEGHLDPAAMRLDLEAAALDPAGMRRPEAGGGGLAPFHRLAQQGGGRRAVVQRRIERRPVGAPAARPEARSPRAARRGPCAGALSVCSHTPELRLRRSASPASARRRSGVSEVARLEREAPRPGPAQCRVDRAGARRKDTELELDLTHGEQVEGAGSRAQAGRASCAIAG
jgi:hypothetical protein